MAALATATTTVAPRKWVGFMASKISCEWARDRADGSDSGPYYVKISGGYAQWSKMSAPPTRDPMDPIVDFSTGDAPSGDDNNNGIFNDILEAGSGDDVTRSDSLFVPDPLVYPHLEHPGVQYRDQSRSDFIRYQGLRRLANLVTTHSNVYAIWITVGFFEAKPVVTPTSGVPYDPRSVAAYAHPDGFRLGRELGSLTGKVKRHRAFFVVDRSVPVAFQPGVNHNVDRCILLRRYIE